MTQRKTAVPQIDILQPKHKQAPVLSLRSLKKSLKKASHFNDKSLLSNLDGC